MKKRPAKKTPAKKKAGTGKMSITKRSAKKKPGTKVGRKKAGTKRKPRARTARLANEEIQLPTDYREPSDSFQDFATLIYGAKKIGKTSICSQFEDATFLMFEPGDRALRVRSVDVGHWREAQLLLKQLEDDAGQTHKTRVVDIVDLAYKRCFEWACVEMGITHPNDQNDYGKSWDKIKGHFSDWITRLVAIPGGTVFLSHDKWLTITRRDGSEMTKLGPTLSGQASEVVTGIVDNIFYYGYDGADRSLVIRGNEMIEAGTRIDEHFLTTDGEPINSVWMGESASQGLEQLMYAWNNELDDVGVMPLIKPKVDSRKTKKTTKKKPARTRK